MFIPLKTKSCLHNVPGQTTHELRKLQKKGILASNFCFNYLLRTTVTAHVDSIPSSLMSSILPFNTNITSLNIYCQVQNMRFKRHYYFKTQITATFKWQIILLRKHWIDSATHNLIGNCFKWFFYLAPKNLLEPHAQLSV